MSIINLTIKIFLIHFNNINNLIVFILFNYLSTISTFSLTVFISLFDYYANKLNPDSYKSSLINIFLKLFHINTYFYFVNVINLYFLF